MQPPLIPTSTAANYRIQTPPPPLCHARTISSLALKTLRRGEGRGVADGVAKGGTETVAGGKTQEAAQRVRQRVSKRRLTWLGAHVPALWGSDANRELARHSHNH